MNVILRNGRECKAWAADGRQPPRWVLDGHDFDIVAWQLAE